MYFIVFVQLLQIRSTVSKICQPVMVGKVPYQVILHTVLHQLECVQLAAYGKQKDKHQHARTDCHSPVHGIRMCKPCHFKNSNHPQTGNSKHLQRHHQVFLPAPDCLDKMLHNRHHQNHVKNSDKRQGNPQHIMQVC